MSRAVTRRVLLRGLAWAAAAQSTAAAGAALAAAGCAPAVVRAPGAHLTVVGRWGQGRFAREVGAALAEARAACDDALGPAPAAPLEVHLVHRYSTLAGVGAVARYLPRTRTIELLLDDRPDPLGDRLQLRGILWHEYVHYVVHERAGGEPVPAWLDEGMAEYFGKYRSGLVWDPATAHGDFLRWIAEDRIPRLAALDALFFATEHARAYTAYAFAYTAVARLVECFGPRAPADCVGMIRQRYTVGGALRQHYGVRLADFEADWQATLRVRYGAAAGRGSAAGPAGRAAGARSGGDPARGV